MELKLFCFCNNVTIYFTKFTVKPTYKIMSFTVYQTRKENKDFYFTNCSDKVINILTGKKTQNNHFKVF